MSFGIPPNGTSAASPRHWLPTTRINGELLPAVLREYFHDREGPHAVVQRLISDPAGRPPARQLWNLGYSNIAPDFVIAR